MPSERWSLILGVSSGFGAATALELARAGSHIIGVHLDRKATLPAVEQSAAQIRQLGRQARFFNMNAADPERRKEVLDAMKSETAHGPVRLHVVMHSLAFGTLLPYVGGRSVASAASAGGGGAAGLTQSQMEMTLDVMAHSLVYWVQDLVSQGFLQRGGRVYAMTSEGSSRVWAAYGAVSAAKSALESHIRQLAMELAPQGITVNTIRAGVTDTPALRKIPGWEEMLKTAAARNPSGRTTTPQDIGRAIVALSHEGTSWITGNVINVDGGEFITG